MSLSLFNASGTELYQMRVEDPPADGGALIMSKSGFKKRGDRPASVAGGGRAEGRERAKDGGSGRGLCMHVSSRDGIWGSFLSAFSSLRFSVSVSSSSSTPVSSLLLPSRLSNSYKRIKGPQIIFVPLFWAVASRCTSTPNCHVGLLSRNSGLSTRFMIAAT